MLSLKEFAARYDLSPSWARRQISLGHLRSTRVNGRHSIASEDAEQWLREHANRAWVRNLSHPDRPAAILRGPDSWVLYLCGRGYNVRFIEARLKLDWRVSRLRERGFTIERGWRHGTLPYYRLKDIVEIELDADPVRVGPHPDYLD